LVNGLNIHLVGCRSRFEQE